MSGILESEPLLRAVYEFCAARRGARAMLSRADIDPTELPRFVLPHLILFDVVEGGARVRWRLIGTEVVNRFGRDVTGRFADQELSGDYLAYLLSLIGHTCRCRVPVYSRAVFRWEKGRTLATSRLYVPLGDAAAVTQIFGVHDFAKRGLAPDPAAWLRDARQIEELARGEVPFEARG